MLRPMTRPLKNISLLLAIIILTTFLVSCNQELDEPVQILEAAENESLLADADDLTSVPAEPSATPTLPPPPTIAISPTPTLSPTPFVIQNPSPPCGVELPTILPDVETNYDWELPPIADELVPEDAKPAIEYLYANPNDVSVVVFQVDYEGIGYYHNADSPMPLASVNKLIHLVAWAKAVENGEFDPNQIVSRDELDEWYLRGSDLGAHRDALREFDGQDLTQDDVAWMMIRHSSNAAADYFHDLLGQQRIEQTAAELGFTSHTAPCTWLGRFLTVSTIPSGDLSLLEADPTAYGAMVSDRQDRFMQDPDFRQFGENTWRRGGQPSFQKESYFTETFDTKGTALDYGRLMAQLIQDEVGTPATSRLIRSHLEWPIVEFPSNRVRYNTVGYKNGTLPGVLTTLYYAEPYWADRPIVVALFYRNLPRSTYQRWRREFPHDALAHWLMTNPQGIHVMHVLRDSAEN
ncbi:MAG: serine hydrolase [Chloroflexota bacterium]